MELLALSSIPEGQKHRSSPPTKAQRWEQELGPHSIVAKEEMQYFISLLKSGGLLILYFETSFNLLAYIQSLNYQ